MAARKPEVENGKSKVEDNQKSEIRDQKPEIKEASTNLYAITKNKQQAANSNSQTTTSPINRELQKELQKQQRKLVNLEEDINKAVQEKLRLEEALGLPVNYADKNKFVAVENDFKKSMQYLESLNKQYEQLFEKVMELETQFAG